jgi:hypothetical protein
MGDENDKGTTRAREGRGRQNEPTERPPERPREEVEDEDEDEDEDEGARP